MRSLTTTLPHCTAGIHYKKRSKQNQSADEICPAQKKGSKRKTLPSPNATGSSFHTMLLFNISIPESDYTAITFYEETVFLEEHRKPLFLK